MGCVMKRPNIVVFLTDQQRWDSCGVHGNPLDLTPNYDRMARRGTHASLAFTPQPVCGPARSCLQTGQYATRTGVWRNGIGLREDAVTLAQVLGAAGYATGYIGKWHLSRTIQHAVPPSERGGYDYWLGAYALEAVSDAYDCRVYDGENRPVKLPGYRVDALTDAAIRHIDERAKGEAPFFLFLSFLEPHHQNHRDDYPAPNGYAERYQGRWTPPDLAAYGGTAAGHLGGYWGMVRRLDEALGRVLDALHSLGIADETVVALTSDHGCHFRTRDSEYKRTGHESSMRVPFVLDGGPFRGGGELRRMASLVDLMPTLIEAAGARVPPSVDGRSLLPLLGGRDGGPEWADEVFAQTSEHEQGRVVRTQRWKYGVVAPGKTGLEGPHADRYVEAYLYDLHADPYELQNIVQSEAHRPVADRLRGRLLAWMARVGEPPAVIEPVPAVKVGQRRLLPGEVEA